MTSDLQYAWEEASSLGVKNRPRGMTYIGTITKDFAKGVKEFQFYKDGNSQYWYESRWKTIKN